MNQINQIKIVFPESGVFALLRSNGMCTLWQEGIIRESFIEGFLKEEDEYSIVIDRQGVTIHCVSTNVSVEYDFKREFHYKSEPIFTYLKHICKDIEKP